MTSVGGIGGGNAPQQSSSKSTIGGRGVSASFDNNSAAIVNTLGQINRAFSNSFVKLNTAVSSIQISKNALEDLLKITNKLISLAERSSERSLNNGDRQRLDNDFQKNIRQFRKILRDTKEDGINLLDKNELNKALKDAGIELEQSAELADTLKKIAGLDNILGIERVRSPEVVVDDIVRKRKTVSYVSEKEITIGDGSFNASTSYSIGITPEFLISADINGNSFQDLLVSGSAPDTLQVLTGNGDGTFSIGSSFALGSVPNKLIYKDITGDGTKDILSLDSNSGTISILAGNLDGSFTSRISYEANGPLSELIAEDFDGDGIIDLATLNTSNNTISILTGNLDGTFSSAISFAAPINPSSISAVDLNGNGNLDLVVSSETGNSITTFFNNGLGSFTPGVSYAVGDTPSKIETRDLNKNGFADIITVNEADNSISILLNNGDGTFTAAISYQTEAGGQSIQVLDYNQNGNIDLVIGSGIGGSPGAVQILRGNGDGSFQAAISYDTGTSATAIAIADFNGDGALDLAVTDTESNLVRILIANTTTTGELDFVGAGTFEKASPGGVGSSILQADGTFSPTTSIGEVSTDGSFQNTSSYEVFNSATRVELADLDGNGVLDLITLNQNSINSTSISIQLGNGDGSFRAATSHSVLASIRDIELKDSNNDGKVDILVLGLDTNFLDGSFTNGVGTYITDQSPSRVELLDIDGDDVLDLITINPNSDGTGSTMSVQIGNGNGTFKASTSYSAPINPNDIQLFDINGNGSIDALISGIVGQENVSTGIFNSSWTPEAQGTTSDSIYTAIAENFSREILADFTGNGILDLVTFQRDSSVFANNALYVRAGNGDGTFRSAVKSNTLPNSFHSIETPNFLIASDLDGDGLLDIVAFGGGGPVSIFINEGDGAFSTKKDHTVPSIFSANQVYFEDVNGNGIKDLVMLTHPTSPITDQTLSVSLGNGDGTFSAAVSYGDIVSISPIFFGNKLMVTDINGDSNMDIIHASGSQIRVFSGNADGTFNTPATYATPAGNNFILDINNDGILDVVTEDNGVIHTVLGNSDGSFNSATSFALPGSPQLSTQSRDVFSDYDNDGNIDLITWIVDPSDTFFQLALFKGNGDGTFSAASTFTSITTLFPYQRFYLGDLTEDGVRDIQVIDQGDGITSYISDSTPPNTTYLSANNPTGINLEDVDGDNILDIITIDPGLDGTGNYLSIQKGNGDGTFLAATSSRLDTFGLHSPNDFETADINGDGEIDIISGHSGTIIGTPSVDLTVSSYQTNSSNKTLLSMDIDGDGNLDLITADSLGNNIEVLLGNGDGSFASAISYVGANSMRSFELQDLDGDGVKDIIFNTTSRIYVMKGNADGSFSAGTSYNTSFPFAANVDFSIGDINGDGILDIVATGRESNNIAVLIGNADGSFNEKIIYSAGTTTSSSYVELVDLDRDGNLDALIYDQGEGRVRFLKGNGDGTFNATSASHTASFGVSFFNEPIFKNFELVDINGDGILDLIGSFGGLDSAMSVSLGNGDGTFRAQEFYETNAYGRYFELADVNGDGKVDIVVTDNDGVNDKGIISLLIGNGDGSFQAFQSFTVSTSAVFNLKDIAVGDFNNDGAIDFAVINNATGSIEILISNNDAPTQQVAYINALTGNGDGNFSVGISYYVAEEMNRFTLSDIGSTPDGNKDVIAAGGSTNSIYTLLGNSDGSYQSAISYAGTGFIYDVLSADLNGNGIQDIIASDSENGKILFYQGNADGSFSAAISYDAGAGASTLAKVDLDGDGILDIVASNGENNTISVLFGNANGSFQARVSYFVDANISDIKAIEANGNGYSDLILSSSSSHSAFLLLNNGDGTLTAPTSFLVGGNSFGVAVGDISGDEINDFVVSNFSQGDARTFISQTELKDILALQLLSGNGDGTFGTSATYATSENITAFTSGSFTQDGYNDIVTADGIDGSVSIFLANSDGSYTARTSINIGGTISDVFTNDVNGDGNIDIIAIDSQNGEAKVLFGNGVGGFVNSIELGGDGSFNSRISYASGSLVRGVQTKDFNNDGIIDIVSADANGSSLSIFIGNGDGTFQARVSFAVNIPTSVLAEDIDGDGNLDLIVPGSNRLSILLGNGDGSFQLATSYHNTTDFGGTLGNVVIGDFNNDGEVDIIGTVSNNHIGLLLGNGDGSFREIVTFGSATNLTAGGIQVGDFNNDGFLDVASSDSTDDVIRAYLGNGDGSFNGEVSYFAGPQPSAFGSFDINGDGILDLVSRDTSNNSTYVLLGNSDGTFGAGISSDTNTVLDFSFADYDNDGIVDMSVVNSFPGEVLLYKGVGDGTFLSPTTIASGSSFRALSSIDLDGDGAFDIVTADGTSNTISVILGNRASEPANYSLGTTPTKFTMADVNGNGLLDIVALDNATNKVLVSFANSNGSFQSAISYAAPANATDIRVADMDQDNGRDILITSSSGESVSILFNNGNGTFQSSVSYNVQGSATGLAIGDTNDDGVLDIAVSNEDLSGVKILLGNAPDRYLVNYRGSGDGTFQSGLFFDAARTVKSLASGDFNNNGNIDVVTADGSDGTVSIYTSNSNGSFSSRVSYTLGGNISDVQVFDFNGDGNLDIAALEMNSGELKLLFGNGDGSFGTNPLINNTLLGSNLEKLSIADLNGDGFADVATFDTSTNKLIVSFGNSNGSFNTAVSYDAPTGATDIRIADFNGNGSNDIVISSESENSIAVFFNNGDGTFQTSISYNVQGAVGGLAVGDLNGDGLSDIAASNITEQDIRILLGNSNVINGGFQTDERPIAAILEDINGNGNLDAIVASTGGINGDASINVLSGNGDGSFSSYISYHAGSDISAFKMADLDNPVDGYKDIVIAGGTSGTVNILQANADGTFSAMLSFFASGDVRDVQIGDFDNDGTIDIIATVVTKYEGIYDLTGDGTNSNADAQVILDYIALFGSGPSGGSPLDVNGDGLIDPLDALIILGHLASPPKGKVLFFQGNGDGSFAKATSFIAGSGADKVSMFDLNNNGQLDLVVTNQGQNSISVLMGNGDGSFTSRVSYNVYGSPVSLSQQDLNGDGFIDLVVGSINESGDDVVNILYGNANGSFQAAISIAVDKGIKDAIAYDFNDDGNQDLIVTSSLTNTTKVYFGNGDGTFTSPTSYQGGRGSSALALGDINNDGLLDFVTTSSADKDMQVYIAQGDLLVSAGGGYQLEVGAYQLASGDLDGDGNIDIISVNRGELADGNSISILFGNGDSSFKAQVSYASAIAPSAAVIADFNGNGFNDIILGADGDDILQLLVNNGDGTFASAITIANISGGVSQIISKDFNGDGILDIALAGAASGEINILLSNGDGSFLEPIILAGGADLRTISAGDINGDGRMDIVAGSAGDSEIRIYSGNGDGYFAGGVTIGQGGDPRGINLADINRNGFLDIVYADEFDGSVAIRYGNGDGTFKSAVRYDAGTSPRDLKLEDLNGDGILDILTIDEASNQLKVLTGNLDGSFKAAITYATSQGPSSFVIGDFNNDGVSDVATLSSENSSVDIFNGIIDTRGVGDGTFGGGTAFDGLAGSSFVDSKLFDINGDGILDVITADGSGNSFSVFQGNGDGSFQAQVSYNVGFSVDRIQVTDVNFDGSRDVIISSSESDSLFISLGNSNGTFNAVSSYQTGQTPSDFTYLDMNQDGIKDLVSISSGDNTLNILLGNANGSFSEMQSIALSNSPGTISKGDVNGDGFEDIAISSSDGLGVFVFLNNGNGSVSAPISLFVGKAVNDAVIGDFNGDGILDVLAVSNNELNLFLGCGDGTFAPRTSFKTNSANERIEVKDLNGNGFLDLVSISESQSNVSVFLNNGDGSFNLASSLDNIDGATSVSIGDLNNDGSLDIISTSSSPDSKLKAFIANTVSQTVTEMEDTVVTEKRGITSVERPRTTSPLDRDVVSRGQAMIAMDSLKKLKKIITKDLKGIDKVLEELTRANKLSEEAIIALEGINPNGISNLSQLAQRLQSRIKASSKDLLLGANDVNRDLIDSLLK